MKKQIIACLNALKSFYRYGTTLSFNILGINYYGDIVRYKHSFKNGMELKILFLTNLALSSLLFLTML